MLFAKAILPYIYLCVLLCTLPLTATFCQDVTPDSNLPYEKRLQVLEQKIFRMDNELRTVTKKLETTQKELENIDAMGISGFFDVSISNQKNQPNIFKIGSLELNIQHHYKNNFQVAAALVFNNDEGTYLGVGFIDYSFSGEAIAPRGRIFATKGSHIQIGLFDVPIGNDWNYSSSLDRLTISTPLTTSLLMEGIYNDSGIRFLFNTVGFNSSFYITQGVEQKRSYNGNTFGFRFGITPFDNPYAMSKNEIPALEVGISYLYDLSSTGENAEIIYAFDFESKVSPFFFRSEYFIREKAAGFNQNSYHITAAIEVQNSDFSKTTIYTRYDNYQEENYVVATYDNSVQSGVSSSNNLNRGTVGVNFNISDISYLKMEYQKFIEVGQRFLEDEYFTEELYYLQLVIAF